MSGRAVVAGGAAVVVAVGYLVWRLLHVPEALTPVTAPTVQVETPRVAVVESGRVDVTPALPEPEPEVVEPAAVLLPPYELEVEDIVCGDITKSIAEQIVVRAKDEWRLVGRGVEPGDVNGATTRLVLAVLPELVEQVADGRIVVAVRPWLAPRAANQGTVQGGSFNIDDEVLHFGWHLPDCYVSLQMTRRCGHPELFDQLLASAKASMGK